MISFAPNTRQPKACEVAITYDFTTHDTRRTPSSLSLTQNRANQGRSPFSALNRNFTRLGIRALQNAKQGPTTRQCSLLAVRTRHAMEPLVCGQELSQLRLVDRSAVRAALGERGNPPCVCTP